MKTYQRGGYFNQSQTFHPFYQPEKIKKEELDKILEADSIADDSTIQNAFYDAPTVVYLFAPYTYPNDAQDCCVAKSFTIRQNKPKNPGEICELPGFILDGNILAILQRSYYNKDKFCGKLIFRRKRQKRRLTFKKQKRSVREMAKILISPSKYLQGAGEMKNIGTYAAKCGKKALVLISQGGYRRIGAMIEESFAGSDCDVVFDYFIPQKQLPTTQKHQYSSARPFHRPMHRAAHCLLYTQKRVYSRDTSSFRQTRTWF